MYKERHLDDTDILEAVGVSSENETKRMKGVLGISRRLPKSAPPTGVPEQSKPAQQGEGEGFIQVPKRDLNGAQNILIDLMVGKKVRWTSAGTRNEVSFSLPQVQPGETSCELCCQSFANTRSFKKYMRNHSGDTGYSCEDCGKSWLPGLCWTSIFKVVGRRCNFIVLSVAGVTQPNKPWWLILGLIMGLLLLLKSWHVLCARWVLKC